MQLCTFNKGVFLDSGVLRQIVLVMKVTTLLVFAFLMQVSAAGLAQKITLNERNASLESVMDKIRSQTGYEFVFNVKDIDNAKRVNVSFKAKELNEALEELFQDQALSFSVKDKFIVVKPKEKSFYERVVERFADRNVRGRVVDEQGNPLPNASIRIKGKDAVINTNEEGEFVIKDVADNAILVISYVGYKQLEISLKDAVMPLEIKLNQVTGELEEVNVNYSTGYQSIPEERATGSFVQIDNELFNRKVGANVLDRILEVTSGLIKQGDNPSARNIGGIQIRGNSTINASTAPLIVVDNFIYEGDLNNLNPNDVENITVLKDAAAASIWGVRAGNGVIVVTTKKGKYNQDNIIALNSNVTIGVKPDLDYVKTMSSKDWLEFEKKQFADSIYNTYDDDYPSFYSFPTLSQGAEIFLAARKKNKNISGYNALNDPFVNQQLNELASHDVKNDIRKYLLQKRVNQQYALNASGGGIKYYYYTSIGFDKNHSNSIQNEDSRLSLNFNNTYKVFKKLELNSFISFVQSKSDYNDISFSQFLPTGNLTAPYTKLADENGNALAIPRDYRLPYVDTAAYPGLLDWHYLPLKDLHNNNNNSRQYDARIGAGIKYTIMPGLKATVKYQFQRVLTNDQTHYNQEAYLQRNLINTFITIDPFSKIISTPYPMGDRIGKTHSELTNWNFRADLGFDRTYRKHAVSAIGGMEYRETKVESESSYIFGVDPNTGLSVAINPTVIYPTRFGGSSVIGGAPEIYGTTNRFGSYFANASYTFMQRYIFSASARADQSNFFGLKANQRITPLWSTGIAWDLSKEDFYVFKFLPYLKLRATYGFNGNTNGGTTFATIHYSNQQVIGYPNLYADVRTPNNPQLKWERVKQFNFAIDFSMTHNRLSGSIEYYTKRGIDLIGPIATDPTVGVTAFVGNRASIKAKGLDLNLNSLNISGKFSWRTNFLLSYNTDMVTRYDRKIISTDDYFNSGIPIVGRPLNRMYSYKWAGLDPTNGSPRIYLGDTTSSFNNKDLATVSDLAYHGSTTPTLFGAFRNTFSWGRFSLSLNITYRLGYYFRRPSVRHASFDNVNGNWGGHSDYVLRWMSPGDELLTHVPAKPPLSLSSQTDLVYSNANILLEKGDHIRLQDVRLDYNLSRNQLKALPFQNIQLYLYANNLGILWARNKYGIDPDYAVFGAIPSSRTFSVGVNVTF
jgi:TonB-linked SusC/RagA family outer membrane protein